MLQSTAFTKEEIDIPDLDQDQIPNRDNQDFSSFITQTKIQKNKLVKESKPIKQITPQRHIDFQKSETTVKKTESARKAPFKHNIKNQQSLFKKNKTPKVVKNNLTSYEFFNKEDSSI